MVRQTPDYDLDADELSVDYFPLPPPRTKARNGSSAQESASSKKTQPMSPPLSNNANGDLPKSNSSRKRAATTSKESTRKRVKPENSKPKTPKRVPEDVFNEPERLLGPPNSLLYSYKTSLTAILLNEETRQILATTEYGHGLRDLSFGELQRACNLFQEDGAMGRHDEEWLAAAWAAHQRRLNGDFDEMLDEIFKERWGGVDSEEYYSDTEDENEGDTDTAKKIVEKANSGIEATNGDVVETNVDAEETNGDGKETNADAEDVDGDAEETNGDAEETNDDTEETNGDVEAMNGETKETNGGAENTNDSAEETNGDIEDTNGGVEGANGGVLETKDGVEMVAGDVVEAKEAMTAKEVSDASAEANDGDGHYEADESKETLNQLECSNDDVEETSKTAESEGKDLNEKSTEPEVKEVENI